MNQTQPSHPAAKFAEQVRAKSFALPSPPRHERNMYEPANVRKMWELYGPQKGF